MPADQHSTTTSIEGSVDDVVGVVGEPVGAQRGSAAPWRGLRTATAGDLEAGPRAQLDVRRHHRRPARPAGRRRCRSRAPRRAQDGRFGGLRSPAHGSVGRPARRAAPAWSPVRRPLSAAGSRGSQVTGSRKPQQVLHPSRAGRRLRLTAAPRTPPPAGAPGCSSTPSRIRRRSRSPGWRGCRRPRDRPGDGRRRRARRRTRSACRRPAPASGRRSLGVAWQEVLVAAAVQHRSQAVAHATVDCGCACRMPGSRLIVPTQ